MNAPDPRRWSVQRFGVGPESALTVAELNPEWAELGRSPILVMHTPSVAYWAQRADILVADGGRAVARLWAPWAKTSEPAPGTVWPWSPDPTGDAGGIT